MKSISRIVRDGLYGDWKSWLIRYSAFLAGMWIMALGIVLMIKAELGLAPWDVFHMGLAYVTPLSVGMWLQMIGLILIVLTVWLSRRMPEPGTLLNMLLVGLFVDGILSLDVIHTPDTYWERGLLLVSGIGLIGLGNGLYIAPHVGAGPRDGLALVLAEKLQWPIGRVRTVMELSVLVWGWLLGGPVFIGTLLFSVAIGPMMQHSIQFWEKLLEERLGRGDGREDIHQGPLRAHHHDGFGRPVRGQAYRSEKRG
ncbi:hypothetical protein GCM10011571_13200 [Marinithermofilum abyssi]|uniref:Membrane protein YczE n=1 Tax=Marinithermofilum abyssi TaxID=1571185 RepID=A0A8J2YAF9_9BACL|nr:YitT family protein [Marinithermofilum abyssi]GGE13146.1 hypothetical protein GCM10011571_13200 [Marinithermofilum abyssi]